MFSFQQSWNRMKRISISVTFPISCINSNCTKKCFNHISQSNTGAVKPSYTYIVIRWCGSCGQVHFVCFGPERERERSWWSFSLRNDWDHWPAIRSGICSRPRGIRDIRAYCWASYRSKEKCWTVVLVGIWIPEWKLLLYLEAGWEGLLPPFFTLMGCEGLT